MNDRLYRSHDDRILFGVAGGVAEEFAVDPSIVRILWAILVIPTGGLALLLYLLMAIIVPEEPTGATFGQTPAAGQSSAAATAAGPSVPSDQSAPSGTSTSAMDLQAAARAARADARDLRRRAREERRAWRREHADPTGVLILGLMLILVGAFFFVRAYVPAIDAGQFWPVLLVALGIALLVGSIRRSNGPTT